MGNVPRVEPLRRSARVSIAVLLATVACTCDAPANRPGASAQPPTDQSAPASAPARFDPAQVALPDDAPERRVIAAGSPADAASLARAALDGSGAHGGPVDAATRGRLLWLAARAAREAELPEAARGLLETLSASDHPLSPWARLDLAEELGEDASARVIELLEALPIEFPGKARAEALVAIALAREGRTDEAIPALRALVAAAPAHVGAATAGMPLAELLGASEEPADREEALLLYRRIATRAPGARVGMLAAERATVVLATLPTERRDALRAIPAADRFMAAEAYFNAMRHEEAAVAFGELAGDPDESIRCRAGLMQGKALLRRRRRDEGSAHLEAVATECDDPDTRAAARYLAARAHGRRGRHQRALDLYDAVVRDAPLHRLADDAVYRSAFSAEALGHDDDMRVRFERAATEFPDGDMGGEALFHLAWDARTRAASAPAAARVATEGRESTGPQTTAALYEDALRHLNTALSNDPQEHGVDLRGRAAYWRARTLVDLGRGDEGAAAYDELARRYPLSYYAQQALRRLAEVAPDRSTAALATMATAQDDEAAFTFPMREELSTDAFARAVELLRVDEADRAMAELEASGLLTDEHDEEALWLSAALLDRAGAHPQASLLARRRLRAFLDQPPTGVVRHRWRIAYPRAFAPLIEEAAEAEGVPPAFVRAIAREESAFNPRAVSVAQAYGLIQLIRPTARRFGDELGLPSDPSSLKTPEINVRIGTRFIGFLFRRYADNPAIVPSAYNAGEGASDRWLRQRGTLPLDEWIESIPYDETRRYTRRVIQTWGTYSWLDEGRLPALSERLPRAPRR
ncbi:MAG: lytic transglycosylase domain-containing protein [Deltaproteobacteria bacterium]|nr:lytic transglycosylase domain-containing protein [Deltaproteobacteria bacterium]